MKRLFLMGISLALPLLMNAQVTEGNALENLTNWEMENQQVDEDAQYAYDPEVEESKGELRFGIEAGAGMSNVFSSNLSQSLQLNESAGFYMNYNMGGFLFETGLKWHRRHYELTGFIDEYTSSVVRMEANPNYLEVPLMAGLMIPGPHNMRCSLKLGMYVACGLGGDGNLFYDDMGVTKNGEIDNLFKNQALDGVRYDKFRRMDVGGKVGIDVYFNRVKVGFEYTRGWMDFQNTYDRHLKSKSFDFTIGYTFCVKRK